MDYMMPPALKRVTTFFFIMGILTCLKILASLVRGHISLDFNFLFLPCAFGLLRFSSGWRTCSLVLLIVNLLMLPISLLLLIGEASSARVNILGLDFGSMFSLLGVLVIGWIVFWSLVHLWCLRVLLDSNVAALFQKPISGPMAPPPDASEPRQ